MRVQYYITGGLDGSQIALPMNMIAPLVLRQYSNWAFVLNR